ncbi:RNA polymerase I associated factor, A49-like protein [Dentipellis sp. KUC8613]|nr:RNA polymerase I associated factor, A49-like protein [Dentipellis sp. KUC8613]
MSVPSSSPLTNKKRKRTASDAGNSSKVTLETSSLPASQVGPVLVSFPSVQPPKSTPFKCYAQEGEDGKDFARQRTSIAGETEAVEFTGSNDATEDDGAGSRYLVAVHHKSTGKVTIQPAPFYLATRQVKSLKNHVPTAPSVAERMQARNVLGETFGTKKAQAAIRAHERNKVDVGAMEGVANVLQERITEGTGNLPTQEEAKLAADAARPIPPYNMEAEIPEDIYPLHGIIPEQEWQALDSLLPQLKAASSNLARAKLLSNTRSKWVSQHLALAYAGPKPKAKTVKLLIYIAAMLSFRAITGGKAVPERDAIVEKMSPTPEIVIDSLISRFTEKLRGSNKPHTTSHTDTNLMTHIFALCLKVDDFATDTTLLASDLRMGVTKVNTLFRSLGAKVEQLTAHELKRLGLPDSAGETKRAVLKAPLAFPKPRAKRKT